MIAAARLFIEVSAGLSISCEERYVGAVLDAGGVGGCGCPTIFTRRHAYHDAICARQPMRA